MNNNSNILPFLIIIFFLIYTLKKFGVLNYLDTILISRKTKQELKDFYSKQLNYFNSLPYKDRDRFVIRANKLKKSIHIIGKNDFKVTEEVRLLSIAAQVQLTFGFNQFFLNKFHTILIYPDTYESKLTGKMHYGEVNPRGIIVISWDRFLKGYTIPNDKINLGLHEMAHALMHTIICSSDHEDGLDKYLRDIVRLSKIEIEKIKNGENHLYRKYAGANIYEFFAVSVEHFFEAPDELKLELPALYQYLTKLLKQDPTIGLFHLKK